MCPGIVFLIDKGEKVRRSVMIEYNENCLAKLHLRYLRKQKLLALLMVEIAVDNGKIAEIMEKIFWFYF